MAMVGNNNAVTEELRQDMGLLKTKADRLDAKATSLDAKVSSLESTVAGLGAKVITLEPRFDNLESKIDGGFTNVVVMANSSGRRSKASPVWKRSLAR